MDSTTMTNLLLILLICEILGLTIAICAKMEKAGIKVRNNLNRIATDVFKMLDNFYSIDLIKEDVAHLISDINQWYREWSNLLKPNQPSDEKEEDQG